VGPSQCTVRCACLVPHASLAGFLGGSVAFRRGGAVCAIPTSQAGAQRTSRTRPSPKEGGLCTFGVRLSRAGCASYKKQANAVSRGFICISSNAGLWIGANTLQAAHSGRGQAAWSEPPGFEVFFQAPVHTAGRNPNVRRCSVVS